MLQGLVSNYNITLIFEDLKGIGYIQQHLKAEIQKEKEKGYLF